METKGEDQYLEPWIHVCAALEFGRLLVRTARLEITSPKNLNFLKCMLNDKSLSHIIYLKYS